MEIRSPQEGDARALVMLAAEAVGGLRAAGIVRSHLERGGLLVAEDEDHELVGLVAFRDDWFECTFVGLVVVAESARRRGLARALMQAVERRASGPRLFASVEETNTVAIRMLRALDFAPSGHVDNLPQGYRELLFYKRIR